MVTLASGQVPIAGIEPQVQRVIEGGGGIIRGRSGEGLYSW